MNIEIRIPNETDIDDLVEAFSRCGDKTRSLYHPYPFSRDTAIIICKQSNNRTNLIIKLRDKIAGFGFVTFPAPGSLESLFGFCILDEYQHKHLGSMFINYILCYSKLHEIQKLRTSGGTYVDSYMKDVLLRNGFGITGSFIHNNKCVLIFEKRIGDKYACTCTRATTR